MRSTLPICLLIAVWLGDVQAQDRTQTPATPSAERRDVLDAARAQVQAQLGKPVRFEVKQLRRVDDWALLHAAMQDEHGQTISYAGTRYEAADRRGQKSASYDALLQRQHGRWTVRVDSIGATDVPWTNWSHGYGAPPALFAGSARD